MKTLFLFVFSACFISCSALKIVDQPTNESKEKPTSEVVDTTPSENFDQGLVMTFSESPIALGTVKAKYAGNAKYASDSRNVFDLWLAESKEPTPLIIFVHGGGFVQGDKTAAYNREAKVGIGSNQIVEFLKNDISFMTINYRLLKHNENQGVLKSLNDVKNAVQFVKYHAEKLNIDPDRIALAGTSAGGGACLWMAFHDDMAEPDSQNPISRQSTRVAAVAVMEAQSTYDLIKWTDEVFPDDVLSKDMLRKGGMAKRIVQFYGIQDISKLDSDEIKTYREKVDMLSMISSDDPPVYILNKQEFKPAKGVNAGNLLHSPYHAVALKKEIEKAGIEHEIYIPAEGSKPSESQTVANFLIGKLNSH